MSLSGILSYVSLPYYLATLPHYDCVHIFIHGSLTFLLISNRWRKLDISVMGNKWRRKLDISVTDNKWRRKLDISVIGNRWRRTRGLGRPDTSTWVQHWNWSCINRVGQIKPKSQCEMKPLWTLMLISDVIVLLPWMPWVNLACVAILYLCSWSCLLSMVFTLSMKA